MRIEKIQLGGGGERFHLVRPTDSTLCVITSHQYHGNPKKKLIHPIFKGMDFSNIGDKKNTSNTV
jgi:hypothetical protein